MAKFESVLRDEIVRLARKEIRRLGSKGNEDLKRLKKRVADLQMELEQLKRARARDLAKGRLEAAKTTVAKTDGQVRLSAGLIKKLRKRLNVSQPELAALVDVSPAAVGFWESEKTQPRPQVKARVVALRSLGRRDVQRILVEKGLRKAGKRVRRKVRAPRRKAAKK